MAAAVVCFEQNASIVVHCDNKRVAVQVVGD